MRKTYKKKLRSCALCKPNKTHGAPRWSSRELDKIRRDEKECRDVTLK